MAVVGVAVPIPLEGEAVMAAFVGDVVKDVEVVELILNADAGNDSPAAEPVLLETLFFILKCATMAGFSGKIILNKNKAHYYLQAWLLRHLKK